MALTLKITVGLLGPYCKKSGELCTRQPVLTPIPSHANHSSPLIAVGSRRVRIARYLHTCQTPGSVPRDTPRKQSFMLDSLVRVSQQQRWKNHKKTRTRRDGHSAELAGATNNSDGKRRTVGYRRRYDVSLAQTVAVGTATENRTYRNHGRHGPDTETTLPQEAEPIRKPLQFTLRS